MSSKDCLVAKFPCFSTSEKHLRIVFHLIMMNLNFLQVSFKKLQRSFKILLAFIFFLNDCKNHNGCGLSTSAAYMQVLTALFADLLSLGKC